MNGEHFHQQKRIETKTEQCERSLRLWAAWKNLFRDDRVAPCDATVRQTPHIFPDSHGMTLEKWAYFFKMALTSLNSRTVNKISSMSGLKSWNFEKQAFCAKNDHVVTF